MTSPVVLRAAWAGLLGGVLYAALVTATTLGAPEPALSLFAQLRLVLLALLHLVPPAVLLATLGGGALALVRLVVRRHRGPAARATQPSAPGRWRLLLATLLLLLAITLHVLDLTLYVGLYAWAHGLLALAGLLLWPLTLGLAAPRALERGAAHRLLRWLPPAALLLPGLALATTGPLLADQHVLRTLVFHRASGLSQALGLATSLWDQDGDGFSPLWGAGDCDDARSERNPFRQEPPGSAEDLDCSGGLTRRTPRPVHPPSRLAGSLTQAATGVQPGILLLTYDALRSDRLRRNGATRDLVPNFERLAAEGYFFGNAYSTSCWTHPAIWGLLTGVHPRHVRWTPILITRTNEVLAVSDPERSHLWQPAFFHKAQPSPLRDPHPALPELLRPLGITSLTATSYVLFRKGAGMSDRFDVVDARPARELEARGDGIGAPLLAQAAIDLLTRHASRGEAFFLWLHLLDPHAPYQRAPGEPDFGPTDADRYDTELWRIDRAVGTLLGWMEQQGLLRRTLIVAAADHGEAFGEHGQHYHASSLYDEQLHVPLLLRLPGPPAGQTFWQPVSLIDVAPTLLELLGLVPPPTMDGRSLLPLLAGEPYTPTPPILECFRFEHRLLGLFDGRHKLITDLRYNTLELFDLRQDPAELRNLADQQPGERDRLRGLLRSWREQGTRNEERGTRSEE